MNRIKIVIGFRFHMGRVQVRRALVSIVLLGAVMCGGAVWATDYCASIADFLNCRPYITGTGAEESVLQWGREQGIPDLSAAIATSSRTDSLASVHKYVIKKYLGSVVLPENAPDAGVKVIAGEPRVVMWAPEGKTSDREGNLATLGFERWGQYTWPKPYRLRDGQIILRVVVGADGPPGFQDSVYYLSGDNGKTWTHIAYYNKETEHPIIDIGFRLPDGEEIRYKERIIELPDVSIYKSYDGRYRIGDLPRDFQWSPMFTRKSGEQGWTEEKSYWDPDVLVSGSVQEVMEGEKTRKALRVQLPEPHATRINSWIAEMYTLKDGSIMSSYHTMDLISDIGPDNKIGAGSASIMLRSYDGGQSWKAAGIPTFATVAGKPWFSPRRAHLETGFADGSWVAFYRTGGMYSSQGGALFISRSTDQGKTWSKPRPIRPCSVNPLGLMLDNGVAVRAYGRPGAYLMFCGDGKGELWGNDVVLTKPWKTQYDENTDNNGNFIATGADRFIYTYTKWDTPNPWGQPRHAVIAQEFIVSKK